MNTTLLRWGTVGAMCLSACGAPGPAAPSEPAAPGLAVDLGVDGDGTPALTVHCAAHNTTGQPVHVFDAPRMPYLIDEKGTLVVLHGVLPPPEDSDLNTIEIPMTRVLGPGETLAFDVALVPLKLHGHYGERPTPPRHGPTPIVCRVAHGATPIDAAAHPHTTLTQLLAWQQLDASPTLVVRLP